MAAFELVQHPADVSLRSDELGLARASLTRHPEFVISFSEPGREACVAVAVVLIVVSGAFLDSFGVPSLLATRRLIQHPANGLLVGFRDVVPQAPRWKAETADECLLPRDQAGGLFGPTKAPYARLKSVDIVCGDAALGSSPRRPRGGEGPVWRDA